MNGFIRRFGWFSTPATGTLVPTHWIDTTPVESHDKPCRINSLDLRVRVCGLYADVTETLVISNPNRRDISASIAIPMPDRAVVSGYALDIDGQMIDGVVVPKEKARVAFETEQRRGVDPGLVESVKGNVYRTRVYPVPRRGTRTVRLRYVAPLLVNGQAAYLDAPMPAERLGERTVRVDVELLDCPAPELSGVNDASFKEIGTLWSAESHERNVLSNTGLRVALPKLPESFALVERDASGDIWFAASERVPDAAPGEAPNLPALTVLWDTSGSRAAVDHGPELELLRAYCAAGTGPFHLISFSDHAEPTLEFASVEALLAHIESLRYDGGSDFGALSQALAGLPAAAQDACVLFTDGMDTLSAEPVEFPEECKILAVMSGAERDTESLRQACGGLVFDLATAPKDANALAKALVCPNLLTGVTGAGVAEVLGIGSGHDGRFSVVGKLAAPSTSISFANTGTAFALNAEGARDGATISRAWAAMRVAQLSPRADENADELLSLGRRFGVVSPATSLLVLETLDQWLRYDIEPPLTWESMHDSWLVHREGAMRWSSDEAEADLHLKDLKRAWAELQAWWSRDYPIQAPTQHAPQLFCMMCGASLEAGGRFCMRCGAPVPEIRERREANLPPRGARMAGSAPDLPLSPADTGEIRLPHMVEADYMAMEYAAPAPVSACMAAADSYDDLGESPDAAPATAASVKVQAWMPDADYLAALDEALPSGAEAAREAYFDQRAQHAASPSFFIDCAGWFMANGDEPFGLSILTNLAELRIEDPALLRVMAWRLREAGKLDRALTVLRRVLKLRPEDSQSHRDLALVLDELARASFGEGNEDAAREFAEEAGTFYRKIAVTPWERRAESIGLFAVEEYNVLRAWANAQRWETAPQLESIGEGLEGVLDCDLRITLAWDADETDVDLHVTEPGGEEAYYGHRLTYAGGRVSEDITDGYGPELYEIRHAKDGVYNIRAHYYASHQQTVFGPASCTLTIYTDWGRPTQTQQITSTRLERAKEMVVVGTAAYGSAASEESPAAPAQPASDPAIVKGADASVLVEAYGTPDEGNPDLPNGQLVWVLSGRRIRVATIVDGKVDRVVERMHWGEELVIVQ